MIVIPNLLLIGGSARNTGKTTFACRVISRISEKYKVTCLKATSIFRGDELLHGTHTPLTEGYEIFKETDYSGKKDTSKMLIDGAEEVFYIRAEDRLMENAFDDFLQKMNPGNVIIAESISLRKIVKPGLFILLTRREVTRPKSSFIENVPLADLVIENDGHNYLEIAKKVSFADGHWTF